MASASPAAIPGVTPITADSAKWQRRSVLIITLVPFVGFLAAIYTLWGANLGPLEAGVALAFYGFTGLGVTVGFHRCFTHKSFEPTRFLKVLMAIAGSMALQGSLIDWVATHRRHHAYSDQEGDPHSPHLDEGPGLKGVMRGLWHAHMGWLATPESTDKERWAPDLLRDRDMVRIHDAFPWLSVATFTLPAMIGLIVTQSFWGMVTCFLWGSLARIFLLHHVTWSINSICHFYGERPFSSKDFSTNNWMLSILSFGESWHNNHHAFPTSAVHGLGRGQIDLSGATIRFLAKVKLAKDVHLVTAKQVAAKKVDKFKVRTRLVKG